MPVFSACVNDAGVLYVNCGGVSSGGGGGGGGGPAVPCSGDCSFGVGEGFVAVPRVSVPVPGHPVIQYLIIPAMRSS